MDPAAKSTWRDKAVGRSGRTRARTGYCGELRESREAAPSRVQKAELMASLTASAYLFTKAIHRAPRNGEPRTTIRKLVPGKLHVRPLKKERLRSCTSVVEGPALETEEG